jgi:SWI/SNF-related matrix-associated actin-dependent regulator 1 of chromatin subfamily A
MGLLSFNDKTNDFFVYTSDKKKAEDVGMTLSTTKRGPNGELTYFTKEHYAALAYWKDADSKARNKLGGLYDDYAMSWSDDWYEKFAVGQEGSIQRANGTRPYQDAAVAYALKRQHTLIGDEMGIGKTCSSIAFANAIGAEKVLVVCPASIRLNWRRQIKLWSTIPQVRTYPILKGKDGVASWSNYTIISYELARNEALHAALRAVNWDCLIIDEAHFLKSYDALRTRALFGGGRNLELKLSLADRAKRVIALTGTPLPNRPRECYTLAHALCPESIDWMTHDEFTYRFNPSARMSNDHIQEAKGRLPELHARLRCNFMIRRLKKDVMKYLPAKQYEFTYIESNGDIAEAMRHERMLDFDPGRDLTNPAMWDKIDGEVSTVRREMGEAKIPRIIEHMKYLLDVEEIDKVVLFCHHKSVMDACLAGLEKYGVVQVRGGMGSTAKDNSVQKFQNDPDTRVFIGQLDAAGFGIDGLQNVASRVVFGEPAWVPGANDQAVDRLHRDGQKFPVLAQFLIVEGSFDERVLGSVLDKAFTINEVLDQQETKRAA